MITILCFSIFYSKIFLIYAWRISSQIFITLRYSEFFLIYAWRIFPLGFISVINRMAFNHRTTNVNFDSRFFRNLSRGVGGFFPCSPRKLLFSYLSIGIEPLGHTAGYIKLDFSKINLFCFLGAHTFKYTPVNLSRSWTFSL